MASADIREALDTLRDALIHFTGDTSRAVDIPDWFMRLKESRDPDDHTNFTSDQLYTFLTGEWARDHGYSATVECIHAMTEALTEQRPMVSAASGPENPQGGVAPRILW